MAPVSAASWVSSVRSAATATAPSRSASWPSGSARASVSSSRAPAAANASAIQVPKMPQAPVTTTRAPSYSPV